MPVAKFGGTSMARPESVADIVSGNPSDWPHIVVSAPGKEEGFIKLTDQLIEVGTTDPNSLENKSAINRIVDRFDAKYSPHISAKALGKLNDWTADALTRFRYRTDQIPVLGEAASAKYFAEMIGARAVVPILDDTCDWSDFPVMLHKDGSINYRSTIANTAKYSDNSQIVYPGFFGFDNLGNLHTLSRGGSDRSGGIISQAKNMPYTNFTDVDGIFTADPKIVSSARRLGRVTYSEQREAANGGNGVLQGDTIVDMETIARITGTNLVQTIVRNTFNLDAHGTTVTADRDIRFDNRVVRLISSQTLGLFTVHDPQGASGRGWIAKLTEHMQKSFDIKHTLTGEDDVTFGVIPTDKPLEDRVASAGLVGGILSRTTVIGDRPFLTLVGKGIENWPTHAQIGEHTSRLLRDANIKTDTMFHHPHSPSIVVSVPQEYGRQAANLLHDELV